MDGNEFLFRSTTPAIKFPVIGSTVVGMITKVPKVTEVTDPATKEVKRWQNGQPKMQVIIDLQTELKETPDDDGTRTLWAKGQMQQAIRDAVIEARCKILEVGGILQVTYAADKPTNLNPQKIYTARYWPPQQGVEVPATPWETQTPAPAAMQQQWAPPVATPATPTPWQQAEQRQAVPAPAAHVAARPVSTPPGPVGAPNPQSFLDKLRQTTANQQAYRDEMVNHRGEPQDVEPPY